MRNCTACNKLLTCAKPKRGTPLLSANDGGADVATAFHECMDGLAQTVDFERGNLQEGGRSVPESEPTPFAAEPAMLRARRAPVHKVIRRFDQHPVIRVVVKRPR